VAGDGLDELPRWPAAAGNGPGDDPLPSADGWLLAAEVVYP